MWHRPATPSSGSLFPSDRLVLSAVTACAVDGAGCRGFRPTASAPHGACTPTGPVPVGLGSFLSVARHLLSAGSVYRPPAGDCGLPFARSIWPFHLRNLSVALSYDFVLLAPVSLPCLGRMGCAVGLRLCCLRFLIYVVFLSRLGLMFSCFANCLFTVDRGIFLWAARLLRFFGSMFSGFGFLL